MQNQSNNETQSRAPFFSVLILFWNSDAFFHTCLDSLNKQTFKDFEIILVDNFSPKPITREELANFPDLNIRLFVQQQNLGFAAGNNFAAAQAHWTISCPAKFGCFPAAGLAGCGV